MLHFYLLFIKAVLTERVAERYMKVEKHGDLICKIETTGYMSSYNTPTICTNFSNIFLE